MLGVPFPLWVATFVFSVLQSTHGIDTRKDKVAGRSRFPSQNIFLWREKLQRSEPCEGWKYPIYPGGFHNLLAHKDYIINFRDLAHYHGCVFSMINLQKGRKKYSPTKIVVNLALSLFGAILMFFCRKVNFNAATSPPSPLCATRWILGTSPKTLVIRKSGIEVPIDRKLGFLWKNNVEENIYLSNFVDPITSRTANF